MRRTCFSVVRAVAAAACVAALGHAVPGRAQAPASSRAFPPAALSNQHLKDGMAAYQNGDFKKAATALKAALAELLPEPNFEGSTAWRVLIDNLGMAQGISGDLKSAKATFDYGVSKDSDYPMFHYNLACVFAEGKQRDEAIGELRQAFKLKNNMIAGERFPNPARDDSFARFMKDKTFLAALDEFRKADRLYPDRLDFTVAGAPWVLTVPAGDFDIQQSQALPDGKQARFLFSSDKMHITASITIEPAVKCTDSRSCRVRAAELPRVTGPKDVASSEIGAVSVFEYLLPEFRGLPVQMQNMYAEFVQDGYWVDLHISKIEYRKNDRQLFEALVNSVKFEPKK